MGSASTAHGFESRLRSHPGDLQAPAPVRLESSLAPLAFRPAVACDQDFSIGRHAGFGIPVPALELQLHANNLLDAIIAKVGVLWSKRGLGIDARHECVDRLLWI